MTTAVRTASLTKTFTHQSGLLDLLSGRRKEETVAVNGVTLEIAAGEIFGLLGPNGAGKTTFVKLLCTLLLPSSGKAYVCGHDVVQEAHRVKQLIGLIASEERSFFWRLTGRQNLEFFARLHHLPQHQANRRADELFELLDLVEVADVRFNEYSTGMRQKLAIARGLLSKPRILLMDEPTKSLDPISAQALIALIRARLVESSGTTIIITTHVLRDVEQLCGRLGIMNKGRMVVCGSLQDLRLISRQYQRYLLRVRGIGQATLRKLDHVRGVINCTRLVQSDEAVEIELNIRKDTNALSDALEQILRARCKILSCTLDEENLEEVFTNLLRGRFSASVSCSRDVALC